jgi:hypothetical protein
MRKISTLQNPNQRPDFCGECDADYCLIHGRSHDNRGLYLVPYHAKPVKAVVNEKPEIFVRLDSFNSI